MAEYGEWTRKGATLSDVTARKEFGVDRDFIVKGIRAGKLEYRQGSIWGAFDEALRYLGICDRATGAPYVTAMDDAGRTEVRRILDQYVKPYLAAQATA